MKLARKPNGQPTGQFLGNNVGVWTYEPGITLGNLRRWDWEAIIGLSRKFLLSVEGATPQNRGFIMALREMAENFPELEGESASFDGPPVKIADLLGWGSGRPLVLSEVMFLHGTSDAVLDAIMAQGLVPRGDKPGVYGRSVGAPQGRSGAVYLTTQEGMARFAAREAAKFLGGKPIIVVVHGLSERNLAPDEDSGQATARASVERIGSVAHNGRISPDHIVEVREIDHIGLPLPVAVSGAVDPKEPGMRRNQSPPVTDVTQTPAFRRWSKGAPVVAQGAPLPEHGPFVVRAYHGSFSNIETFWTDGPEAPEDDEGEHRIEAGDPNVYWGAHFALEPHVADKFAGVGGDVLWLKMRRGAGRVYPVYLRLENPVHMTEHEMHSLSLQQALTGGYEGGLVEEYLMERVEDGHWGEASLDELLADYDSNVYGFREGVNEELEKFWDDLDTATAIREALGQAAKRTLVAQGYDSVIYENRVEGGTSVIVFSPTQIKSAIGNRGTFDPSDPDIRHNPRENQKKKASSLLDNPAFRRWFGYSKVVDKRGRPLVVYHGSTKGGFTKFRRGGAGIYFTDCRGVATTYVNVPTWEVTSGEYRKDPTPPLGKEAKAQPGTYAVYLRIEAPLVLDAEGNYFDDLPHEALDEVGISVDEDMQISMAELAQIARDRGCDGIIVHNVVDTGYNDEVGCDGPSTVYVVFDPRQIKSASVQRGTYDPEDPDIRHNPRRGRR